MGAARRTLAGALRGRGPRPIVGVLNMSKRFNVNKHRSAAKFRGNVKHTKAANMRQVMRGGWRM